MQEIRLFTFGRQVIGQLNRIELMISKIEVQSFVGQANSS